MGGMGEGGGKIHCASALKLVPGMDLESVSGVGWGILRGWQPMGVSCAASRNTGRIAADAG